MYQTGATIFGAEGTSHNPCATQAHWSTFLNQIRKKLQRVREAQEAEAEEVEEE
jgi:DNA-binding IscR family transcriptional regulator